MQSGRKCQDKHCLSNYGPFSLQHPTAVLSSSQLRIFLAQMFRCPLPLLLVQHQPTAFWLTADLLAGLQLRGSSPRLHRLPPL
jgi:hypothetical protein